MRRLDRTANGAHVTVVHIELGFDQDAVDLPGRWVPQAIGVFDVAGYTAHIEAYSGSQSRKDTLLGALERCLNDIRKTDSQRPPSQSAPYIVNMVAWNDLQGLRIPGDMPYLVELTHQAACARAEERLNWKTIWRQVIAAQVPL